MCGIFVAVSKKKKIISKQQISKTSLALNARGPDVLLKSLFLKKKVLFINTILSVNGSLNKSKKLFRSKSKRFNISYNGEIYNQESIAKKYNLKNKFTNDTSFLVSLHDYENPKKIMKLLDGMYAYAVYDNKEKKIYFGTDPQGEKKLFLYNDENYFLVSSNINSIIIFLKNSQDIAYNELKNYFATRHLILDKTTIYKNISLVQNFSIFEYDIIKDSFKKKNYDNPVNWISKKKYLKFKKQEDSQVINYFDHLFKKTLHSMVPNIKFGSIFSGGVDSSLQSYYLTKYENLKYLYCLHHPGKDKTTENMQNFEKFINKKIIVKICNAIDYFKKLKLTYSMFGQPLLTHEPVGKNIVFNFFKKKKIKVVFSGDGADELFGGYSLYQKIDWSNKKVYNMSPYSNHNEKIRGIDLKKKNRFDNLWKSAFKKYNTFLNLKESKMQASLFCDYFLQCVYTHNHTTHVLSGENSVETRNMFLNKTIIKNALNLPIKYKINLNSTNSKFVCKPILKKLFVKYFSHKLLYPKQGFPGYPNESLKFLKSKERSEIFSLFKKFKTKLLTKKSIRWKILNIYFFKKFVYHNLNIDRIFKNE